MRCAAHPEGTLSRSDPQHGTHSAPLGTPIRPWQRLAGAALLAGTCALGAAIPLLHPDRILARARSSLPTADLAAGARPLPSDGMIWQQGWTDCGPAALANWLRLSGQVPPSLDTLSRLTGLGPRGTRLGRLAETAATLHAPVGLKTLNPTAGPQVLARYRTPLLVWMRPGHFVTVAALTPGDSVDVLDPLRGRQLLPWSLFSRRWNGVVMHPADAGCRGCISSSPIPGEDLPR